MNYGYFDDTAKEYVITRPDTPTSWSNYLGSTEYGAIITNNAGGYGFYKSGARGRFLRLLLQRVPMDQPGRYFYLRDRDSGDYWSASWQPVGKPLEQYTVHLPPRHRLHRHRVALRRHRHRNHLLRPAGPDLRILAAEGHQRERPAARSFRSSPSANSPTSGSPSRTRSTCSTRCSSCAARWWMACCASPSRTT